MLTRHVRFVVTLFVWLLCACGPDRNGETLTVAAAANLAGIMDELAAEFTRETSARVTLSYGSTAQLSRQIENGAPFDVFAAADTAHVDELIAKGRLTRESRAIYARGQLALWSPPGKAPLAKLDDLIRPEVRFLAIAQPAVAPYGRAAVEVLRNAGLWDRVQPKVVYANNIGMARQYASSRNADAAFTALSLVKRDSGHILTVDPALHSPIDQALGINAATRHAAPAAHFRRFLLGGKARSMLRASGYLTP